MGWWVGAAGPLGGGAPWVSPVRRNAGPEFFFKRFLVDFGWALGGLVDPRRGGGRGVVVGQVFEKSV